MKGNPDEGSYNAPNLDEPAALATMPVPGFAEATGDIGQMPAEGMGET